MPKTYLVSGMTCDGCVRAVKNAIQRSIPGAMVEVDLAAGKVTVGDEVDERAIARAVDDAGFEFSGTV